MRRTRPHPNRPSDKRDRPELSGREVGIRLRDERVDGRHSRSLARRGTLCCADAGPPPRRVDAFLAAAGPFLAAREAEHNLIFGILSSLRETPEAYTGPAYLGTVHDADGEVTAAAIQTPPYRLVLSEIDDPAAIQALAGDTVDRDLAGVLGPVGTVETFVEGRQGAGGPAAVHTETEQVYQLSAVRSPRPVAGTPARNG